MRNLFMTEQFKSDLDNLDKVIKLQVDKTIKQISEDPRHPGLKSHSQASIQKRKIMRSRVNENFRILWEWLEGGGICLWRVGKHDVIDAIGYLPTESDWTMWTRDKETHQAIQLPDWRKDLIEARPFRNVPDNILRLFGVPDNQLGAVKAIRNPEEIWDLQIAENVQYTLYGILEQREDWTVSDLLNTRQLLYRATVDQLEGYCEGKIKRLLLNLTDEQRGYVHINASGPVLIKGVAGSGKTTIGLYRAHYLAEKIAAERLMFGEETSILLLTYTKTLTRALEQLYAELYGDQTYNITIRAYKEWMLEQLQSRRACQEAEWVVRERLAKQAYKEIAKRDPTQNSVRFLLAEIDMVIRARGLASLEDYQAIDRVGRGIGLDRKRQRPIVWQMYQLYQQSLDEENLFDWADLARLVQIHCGTLPQYDVVIIDEAQDLPPSDLNLATRLLSNYDEHRSLTLLADPAQSIYYRGIPWKEAGINIQGRTRTLAKNFRNTQQVLEAARHIVDGCQDLKAEEEYIPPTSTYRLGPKPYVVRYASTDESNRFLADEIIKLCQSGKYRPGDIAVLARNRNFLRKWVEKFLRSNNIHCRYFRDDEFHILENEVKLITMHSAKGLEYPVVFVIGLDDRYMPYIRDDSDTKAEDELQERKLFYVSMTRAAERLYLLHPQRNRSRFLYDLDESTVTNIKC